MSMFKNSDIKVADSDGITGWVKRHRKLGWGLVVFLFATSIGLPFLNAEILERYSQLADILGFGLAAWLAFLERKNITYLIRDRFFREVIVIILDGSGSMNRQRERVSIWVREHLLPRSFDCGKVLGIALAEQERTRWLFPPGHHELNELVSGLTFDTDGGNDFSGGLGLAIVALGCYGRREHKRIIFVTDEMPTPYWNLKKFEGIVSGVVVLDVHVFPPSGDGQKGRFLIKGRGFRSLSWLPFFLILLFAFRCLIGDLLRYRDEDIEPSQGSYAFEGSSVAGVGKAPFGLSVRSRSAKALRHAYHDLLVRALAAERYPERRISIKNLLIELESQELATRQDLSLWFREKASNISINIFSEVVNVGWLDCCGRAQVQATISDIYSDSIERVTAKLIEEKIEQHFDGYGWSKDGFIAQTLEMQFSLEEVAKWVDGAFTEPEVRRLLKAEGILSPGQIDTALVRIYKYRENNRLGQFDSADYRLNRFVSSGLEKLARILVQRVRDSEKPLGVRIIAYGSADPRNFEKGKVVPGVGVENAQYFLHDSLMSEYNRNVLCARTSDEIRSFHVGSSAPSLPIVVDAYPILSSAGSFLLESKPTSSAQLIGDEISDNCELSVARAFYVLAYLADGVEQARLGVNRSDGRFSYGYAGYGAKILDDSGGSGKQEEVFAELRAVEIDISVVKIDVIR